jgi:hypothetical protein
MKKESNFFIIILSFLIGFGTSYFLTQFHYLDIDFQINAVETLLSIITAIIGLYIAISIQKKNNRNQSLHNLLQGKLDSFLSSYSTFEKSITVQSSMRLSLATSSIKTLNQDLCNLKALFNSFSLQCNCVDSIENCLDDLDDLLTAYTPVINNNLQLSQSRSALTRKSNAVTKCIADAYVEINKIL